MARKKSKSPRRRPAFSILNALESLTYAEILSRGISGGGVWSFITNSADAYNVSSMVAEDGIGGYMIGKDGQVTLQDLVKNPQDAIQSMASMFQSNLIPMATAAFTTSISFRIGRKLLRMPINNINRNLIRPALGRTVRL
jgi:hypothetical protein